MSDYFPSYRTKIECDKTVENALKESEKSQNGSKRNDDDGKEITNEKNSKLNLADANLGLARTKNADAKGGDATATEKVKQKKKKMKKKKGASAAVDSTPEDEDDLLPPPSFASSARIYKESTSLDSGIESDHCRAPTAGETCSDVPDAEFTAFLARHDEFLDGSVPYIAPKFTLNRVDNMLAFTLQAKHVSAGSIVCEKLVAINAARVKFATTAPKVQNYAFFVRFNMPHKNNNNNNIISTAMITEASAESWDNNVVFQIDLEPRYDDELSEYSAGLDQYHLSLYPMESKIETVPVADEHEDEGFSIEVENASENEIKIAIKAKEPLKPQLEQQQQQQNSEGAKRRNNNNNNAKKQKPNRLRAYSESCCDELKVISESECLKLSSSAVNQRRHNGGSVDGATVIRKSRSISESYHENDHDGHNVSMPKYKSILKHSYDHSISMDSSVDDLLFSSYSASYGDYQNSATDHELSESCKKSVRFSDHITRTLYKSNSSILGQRKKNQRKNDAKKRALQRKNSEGESADDTNDFKENHIEEEEEVFVQKGKRGSKSNMIFDLEIDDDDDD